MNFRKETQALFPLTKTLLHALQNKHLINGILGICRAAGTARVGVHPFDELHCTAMTIENEI